MNVISDKLNLQVLRDLLLTGGILVVFAIVVAVLLLLPVAAELLVEEFGAAVEFVSMEMLASIIVEWLCPAPKVKREPTKRKNKIDFNI